VYAGIATKATARVTRTAGLLLPRKNDSRDVFFFQRKNDSGDTDFFRFDLETGFFLVDFLGIQIAAMIAGRTTLATTCLITNAVIAKTGLRRNRSDSPE
jgi:hypothetical protein